MFLTERQTVYTDKPAPKKNVLIPMQSSLIWVYIVLLRHFTQTMYVDVNKRQFLTEI